MDRTGVAGGIRKTGWGASGKVVQGAGVSRIVSMQVDFPNDVATSYTVQFRSSVPGNAVCNPEALITWSVEGQFVTRRVSIGDGTSVTGVGQAVNVKIQDNTPAIFITPGAEVEYSVSVQVAPGFRGASELPPTLYPFSVANGFLFEIPAGGNVAIPIPGDAGVTQVFVTAVGIPLGTPIADATAFAIVTNGPFAQREYDVQRVSGWVPVNPGATQLDLFNTGATQINFTVAFGIDG
jgi:hypothetical protein